MSGRRRGGGRGAGRGTGAPQRAAWRRECRAEGGTPPPRPRPTGGAAAPPPSCLLFPVAPRAGFAAAGVRGGPGPRGGGGAQPPRAPPNAVPRRGEEQAGRGREVASCPPATARPARGAAAAGCPTPGTHDDEGGGGDPLFLLFLFFLFFSFLNDGYLGKTYDARWGGTPPPPSTPRSARPRLLARPRPPPRGRTRAFPVSLAPPPLVIFPAPRAICRPLPLFADVATSGPRAARGPPHRWEARGGAPSASVSSRRPSRPSIDTRGAPGGADMEPIGCPQPPRAGPRRVDRRRGPVPPGTGPLKKGGHGGRAPT